MMMRVIDFFCGAGGSSLGATWAGGRVVAAVNHWEIAALSYERNHHVRPLRESCQDVSPADLPRADVMLFSPECTSHSRARGARPRDEMSRATAWQVVRFVGALAPRAWVVENVTEIAQWPPFGEWVAALRGLGYHVNHDAAGRPGQVLDASEFGVPQARRRWFLVGCRDFQPIIVSPRLPAVPVAECIDWSLPSRPITRRERPLAAKTLHRIEEGRRRFGSRHLVQYNGTATAQPLDSPCRTVTTRDRFALVDGDNIRMLSPRELLRIMGFPEDYYLEGNRSEQIAQVGNAVAPPVMRAILEQVS